MKKTICLLAVLALCFAVATMTASAEQLSLMDQAAVLIEAEDYDSAVPLLQEAADQGEVGAQIIVGSCYAYGIGVEQNDAEAFRYYQMAADQGDAMAQFSLGLCYDNGFGVEKNGDEALKYYQLAADQGDANAIFNIGFMYYRGESVGKGTSVCHVHDGYVLSGRHRCGEGSGSSGRVVSESPGCRI